MVSRAQMAEKRAAEDQLRRLVERDIRQIWRNVDTSDKAKFRQVILNNIPALVDEYGKINATLAAEFFEDVAGRAPIVAAPSKPEASMASARWAIGPAWEGKDNQALTQLVGVATRHVAQAGRDTIHQSTRNARGLRYARVPGGGDTCDWCLVYASRGAVYASEESAGGEGNDYHDLCYCEPVPMQSEDDYPPGYDPAALYAEYKPAYEYTKENNGTYNIKAVAKNMAKIRSGKITL